MSLAFSTFWNGTQLTDHGPQWPIPLLRYDNHIGGCVHRCCRMQWSWRSDTATMMYHGGMRSIHHLCLLLLSNIKSWIRCTECSISLNFRVNNGFSSCCLSWAKLLALLVQLCDVSLICWFELLLTVCIIVVPLSNNHVVAIVAFCWWWGQRGKYIVMCVTNDGGDEGDDTTKNMSSTPQNNCRVDPVVSHVWESVNWIVHCCCRDYHQHHRKCPRRRHAYPVSQWHR